MHILYNILFFSRYQENVYPFPSLVLNGIYHALLKDGTHPFNGL